MYLLKKSRLFNIIKFLALFSLKKTIAFIGSLLKEKKWFLEIIVSGKLKKKFLITFLF